VKAQWIVFGLAMGIAALVIASACSSGSGGKKTSTPSPLGRTTSTSGASQSQVAVTLVEYKVVPQVTSVPAGHVRFDAKNIGASTHELHVTKTDLQPNALPAKADGSVDEGADRLTMIGRVTDIASGTQKSLTANLQPGHYVLFCNIVQTTNGQTVGHYAKGMATDFTVTQ